MQLGESGSPRPDVYTMEPTYTRLSFEAFECKVSKGDFRADVTAGKWQSYLKFANCVTFAAPAGLITKADVPSTCGLILRSPSGQWRYAKRPVRNVLHDLPWKAWIKLLLDGVERANVTGRTAHFNEWHARQKLAKKFGEDVAKMVADINGLPARLEYEKAELVRQLERENGWLEDARKRTAAEQLRAREACSGALLRLAIRLGLPQDADVPDLTKRAEKLLDLLERQEGRWSKHPLQAMAERMEALATDLRAAGVALAPAPAEGQAP